MFVTAHCNPTCVSNGWFLRVADSFFKTLQGMAEP